MILELINPAALISLRLVGAEGTRHEATRCRIADITTSEDEHDYVLRVVPDVPGAPAASVGLALAAEEYLVEPGIEAEGPSDRTLVSLRTYLYRLHRRLRGNWPRQSEQQTVLECLLDPPQVRPREGGKQDRWIRDATRWLHLESLRANASAEQSTRDFFLDAKTRIDANLKQLGHPLIARVCRRTWQVDVVPAPHPASLLSAIRLARGEAESAAAAATVSVVPFLEAALEEHWLRMIHEDPVLNSAWGLSNTSVKARVSPTDEAPGPAVTAGASESRGDGSERSEIQMRVTFRASPQPDEEPVVCTAVLTLSATTADAGLPKRLGRLRDRLAFHLNDTQWSLEVCFRNTSLVASPTPRRVFRDGEQLATWLAGSPDTDAQARIRCLSKSWMRAGAPQLQPAKDAAACPAVDSLLPQLMKLTAGTQSSIGHQQSARTPADIHAHVLRIQPESISRRAEVPQGQQRAWVTVTYPIWRHRTKGLVSSVMKSFRGLWAR